MANNVIKRVWNQNRMVNIEDLKGMAFQAEQAGHTFEISGIDDAGNVVELSGTPSGVMLRPDNTDQVLTCSISGGKVYATLPAACYDVPGRFALTVFVTANSQKVAVYAAIGTVSRTSSGTASPGTTQDVIDLINAINAAIAQIPASDTNLKAALAPTYSSSGLYAVGDYCWYDGVFYRCITLITSGETWTSGHWIAANLAVDVASLKSATLHREGTNYFYPLNVSKNTAINSSGVAVESTGVDSTDFLPIDGGFDYVGSVYGFTHMFQVIAWYNSDKTFINRVTSTSRATIPSNAAYVRFTSLSTDSGFVEGLQFQKGYFPTQYVGYYDVENVGELIDNRDRMLTSVIATYKFLETNYDLFISRFTIDGSLNWGVTNLNKGLVVPIYGNSNIQIKGGEESTVIVFLRNKYRYTQAADVCYKRDENNEIVYVDGHPVRDPNARIVIGSNTISSFTAPEEARYMYMLWETGTDASEMTSRVPSFLSINNNVCINNISNENVAVNYQTVLFDDFDSFDENTWHFHNQPSSSGSDSYYNSLFYNSDENVYVDSSCLVLKCKKPNEQMNLGVYRDWDGVTHSKEYIAGYISTAEAMSVRSGKITAKIKFSDNLGANFGGCFWTFGQDNQWSLTNEMDIAEIIVGRYEEDVYTSKGILIPAKSIDCALGCHTHGTDPTKPDTLPMAQRDTDISSFMQDYKTLYENGAYSDPEEFFSFYGVKAEEWHIYGVEWSENEITYTVDENAYFKVSANNYVNEYGNHGFVAPQYVCFNVKANQASSLDEYSMFVDWVKVEVEDIVPLVKMSHPDISIRVGETYYLNPNFYGATNCSYVVETETNETIEIHNYESDWNRACHTITGLQAGQSTVTLKAGNGKIKCTFTVTVTAS